jgi:T5SS/PEP-CTERM-associated repeat protein
LGGDVTSAESRIGGGAGGDATVGFAGRWTTGNLALGIDGGSGELTIKDGGKVFSDRAIIGRDPILGNNASVQGGEPSNPSTWHPVFLTVGAKGAGQLTVRDGGLVTVDVSLSVAAEEGGTGTVTVGGLNASALPSRITAEQISVGAAGDGEMLIKESGMVETLSLAISGSKGRGKVTVEGLPSINLLPSKLKADELTIGSKSPGSMVLFLRAEVQSRNARILCPDDPSTASKVEIGGIEASWKITDRLTVGTEGDTARGRAILSLVRGFLSATDVIVAPRGWILGSGTVSNSGETVNNGTIGALLLPSFNVVASPVIPRTGRLKATAANNDAISQEPSFSTITIEGKYSQGPQGRLLIEIGGTNPEAHGHLIITKEATLDGTLELRFINGFAPKRGDTFDFLHVGGALNNTFSVVELKNLAADFQFNISTNGTNISLVALNDGTFVPPLQGQISSSNVLTVGGISYLPYTLQVTNDCSIVEPTGPLRREGQELIQTLSEWSDPACEERSANVSRILPLGALPPGEYQFHFILDGVAVYDASFRVPDDRGELLKITRVSREELKLEISGLPGVLYTLEASADLMTWSALPAHVGTLLGPYSVLEPFSSASARFYRVKVESGG